MISYAPTDRNVIDTALGNIPAHLVIKNGVLMDVYSGRLIPNRSIAVYDKWIAYVGDDATFSVGDRTTVIDAGGRVLCPGYIDAHTHLANYWDFADFLSYAIPCGVTTYVTEVESTVFTTGIDGFDAFLNQIENRPVKVFSLIPPMISASPATEPMRLSRDDVRRLLKNDLVLGLGESYWQGTILTDDDRVLQLIEETVRAGKSVEGHAAGAFDRKLSAYAATGADSCHEAITTEDVLARLERGYYTMIRVGDIRDDLDIIVSLNGNIQSRRLILVTDGTNPSLLVKQGYLVDVLERALAEGLDPVEIVQMASLNAAEHFRIDRVTGGIAPGRCADILILPEPGTMRPDLVISNGRIVAENGEMCVPLDKIPHPGFLYKTVRVDPLQVSDLHVPTSSASSDGTVRCIDIHPGGLVTREGEINAKITDSSIIADPANDVLKIVFIERNSGKGERFVGFVRGWGQRTGAVATTLCWDSSAILAIGAEDEDIVTAVNHVIKTQGGTCLCVNQHVEFEIPLPIAGFISQLNPEELSVRLETFQDKMRELGSNLESAHLTLNTLSTTAIPFISMTEKGYYRFRENDIVSL